MFEFKKNKYSKKIISAEKLKKSADFFPRSKKVILCHGNFDVVHPGHIRHLLYAKTKASILVVSITADKFIEKGVYRPFVPQELRALNLATLEMVDYVIIDNNKTPIKNIKKIKPDFFAKGFEYSANALTPATHEESKVVESYGGEMIFTPGDVVYSSTKLLKLSEPKIEIEKLLNLMELNNISFSDLKKTLNRFKDIKIHVVGDTIIDTYTRTNLIGGHTKTPTPSLLYQEKNDYVGGAGIVAQHLKASGAKVSFTTVLGNDNYKKLVISTMKKKKINLNAIIDHTRPTTNKNTILSGSYKLVKIDTLDNQPISEKILKKISDNIKKIKADIVIFSDFRHGIFNKKSIPILSKSIKSKIFKVADSQVATRWGNIIDFLNFDLITPNEREARFSLADQDSSISVLSRNLVKKTKLKNLILKLGERGLVSVNIKSKNNLKIKDKSAAFALPSFAKNVIDSTGTGDALLAYTAPAIIITKSLVLGSILGSLAAAAECEKNGNIEITPQEIEKKLIDIENSTKYNLKN